MKICPQCQTSYTDDTLQFCLQDGNPLASQTASNNWGESETVVSAAQPDKIRAGLQNSQPQQNWAHIPEMKVVEPPKKSNTALTVVLTALLTLLAVGAIVGALYYTRNRKTEVAQNTNSKPVNALVPNVSKTNKTSNINSANVNSANSDTNTAPSVTPTPKPAINTKDVKNIESDIENVIDDWKDSTENFDLNTHLANYAETVDYYRAGKVSNSAVRADKQNAFAAFSDINIDISNMRIMLDTAGENATALFDKEWNFEGEGKSSAGKVQQQLQLTKIDGQWRITGERDLKVYYTR